MKDFLTSVPAEKSEEFLDYVDDWFDDGVDFDGLKRVIRAAYKLWDSWDPIDYEAVKVLSSPRVTCIRDVALVCWNHNETWFREQVIAWMELVSIRDAPDETKLIFTECSPWCSLYTRHSIYDQGSIERMQC